MRDRHRTFDLVVAVGVVTVGQLEVWASGLMADVGNVHMVGPTVLNSVTYLSCGLALLLRRRYPAGVLTFELLAMTVLALIAGGSQGLGGFLPLLIALYSVARWCDDVAITRAGLVMALLAAVVHDLRDPLIHSVADVSLFSVLIVLDWMAGRGLHARQRQVGQLQEKTELLQAQNAQHGTAIAAQERQRISRELHDVVAHHVSLAVIQSVVALELLDANKPTLARARIVDGETAAREALVEMRKIVDVLASDGEAITSLTPQPGVATLPQLVAQVTAAGVAVDFAVEGAVRNVSSGFDLSLFRIVQEALTNTLKHAHATNAAVRIRYHPDAVEVVVTDNGNIDSATSNFSAAGGRGLIGMRERATMFGGLLECGPQITGGWGLRAYLPIAVTE